MSATLHLLSLVGFAAHLLWAAASDVRRRLVPNRIPLAIAGLFALFAATGAGAVSWLGAAVAGAGLLLAGGAAFRAGWLGGGDAKLMAAVGLWAGVGGLPLFLTVTTLAGGALAVAALVRIRFAREGGGAAQALARAGLPYAVAIAAGGAALLPGLAGV